MSNIQILRSNTPLPSVSIVEQAYDKRMKSEDFFLSFFHEKDATEQQRIISYFSSKHPDLLSLETNDPQYLLQKALFLS